MVNGQMTILGSRVNADDYRYQMDITSEGAVPISGVVGIIGSITIGSINAHVDSIYVTSGTVFQEDNLPTSTLSNNPYYALVYVSSGTSTGLNSGSAIGTVVQHIGAGSYVKALTYVNNNLVNVGSWS